jgi:hypothetical protein
MDVTPIAVVLWGAAALGVIAAVSAVALPRRRSVLFLVAAVLFLPIGVLGILSIGVVFLAAVVACLVESVVARRAHLTAAGRPPADEQQPRS